MVVIGSAVGCAPEDDAPGTADLRTDVRMLSGRADPIFLTALQKIISFLGTRL